MTGELLGTISRVTTGFQGDMQLTDSQEKSGYVYFVYCEGFIKIGLTILHPRRRLADMKIGCPFPMHLAVYWEMEKSHIMHAERFLHDLLDAHAVSGEWFSIPPDAIAAARPALLAHLKKLRSREITPGPRRVRRIGRARAVTEHDLTEALDLMLKSEEYKRIQKSAAITRRLELAAIRRALNESDDIALTLWEQGLAIDGEVATTSR